MDVMLLIEPKVVYKWKPFPHPTPLNWKKNHAKVNEMGKARPLRVQWLNVFYCPLPKCITVTISRDWRLDSEANGNVKSDFIVKRKTEKGSDEVWNLNKEKCHFYWISALLFTFQEWELLTKSWIYISLWRKHCDAFSGDFRLQK